MRNSHFGPFSADWKVFTNLSLLIKPFDTERRQRFYTKNGGVRIRGIKLRTGRRLIITPQSFVLTLHHTFQKVF